MAETNVRIKVSVGGSEALDQLNRQMKQVQAAAPQAANGIKAFEGATKGATGAVGGLGAALAAALGPILSVAAAIGAVQKGLEAAFARQAAEQRLQNFTGSAEEYSAALGVAAQASQRFGMSQTAATTALSDVYTRLKPLGFGLKEISGVYQGFNVIAKQSGTSTEAASSAFLQLSQALGSGRLQGDEFRSVAEQLPGILDVVSQEMGVSVGQLKEMSSQGKITSDVIVNALMKSAEAGGELSSTLTAQQVAFGQLGRVTDQLLVQLGQVFGPAVVASAEVLAAAGQHISDWWGYLGSEILPQVQNALKPVFEVFNAIVAQIDWDYLINILQNVMLGALRNLIKSVENWAKAVKWVFDLFAQWANNPIMKALIGAVQTIVAKLGLAAPTVKEWAAEQKKVTTEAAASAQKFTSMPPPLTSAKDAAKELKDQIAAGKLEIQAASEAAMNLAESQGEAARISFDLAQGQLQVEQELNSIKLQGLKAELDKAQTYKESAALIQQIYELEVAQARVAYQLAVQKIAEETRLAALAAQKQQLKLAELEAERALLAAKGQEVQLLDVAVEKQRQALQLASAQLAATRQLGQGQVQVAQATYNAALKAADLSRQTSLAAAAAKQMQSTMQGVAAAAGSAAASMASAAAGGGGGGGGGGGWSYAFKNLTAGEFRAMHDEMNRATWGGRLAGRSWDGASVTIAGDRVNDIRLRYMELDQSRARALGRENERQAQERWSSLASKYGGVTSSVTVNNTGPVLRFNDSDYVSTSDVPGIIDSAVSQTMGTMQRSSGSRYAVGMR